MSLKHSKCGKRKKQFGGKLGFALYFNLIRPSAQKNSCECRIAASLWTVYPPSRGLWFYTWCGNQPHKQFGEGFHLGRKKNPLAPSVSKMGITVQSLSEIPDKNMNLCETFTTIFKVFTGEMVSKTSEIKVDKRKLTLTPGLSPGAQKQQSIFWCLQDPSFWC